MVHPVKKEIHSMRVGPQGRVVLPARLRKQIGLVEGDMLVIWPEDERLILRRQHQIEEELWAIFRSVKGSPAKELIKERRKEAGHENRT